MQVTLCRPRGFCAGVVRAISIVRAALNKWGKPIYVKHEIVHNRHVVEELRAQGVIFVEDLEEIPEGSVVVYSAHGVSPEVRVLAQKRNLIEVDASCGLVTKVHSLVKLYAKQGFTILLLGHKDHVEVIGIQGEAPDQVIVISTLSEVEDLSFTPADKLFLITQTTLSIYDVEVMQKRLLEKFPQIVLPNSSSVCYATTNRQKALYSLLDKVDLVLVVGGQQSSNSNRLVAIATTKGVPAYLLDNANSVQSEWFEGVQHVALTAGASTPENMVQEVVQKLCTLGADRVEEDNFLEENVVFSLPKVVANFA